MKSSTIAPIIGLCIALSGCIPGSARDMGRAADAVEVAASLEKDIKSADEKIKELGEVLQSASEALGHKEFPATLATKLGVLEIPFDATHLSDPGVMGLPAATLKMLLHYTSGVESLNEDAARLKNIASAVGPLIEKSLREEKDLTMNYSVILHKDGARVVAELAPNKDPFKLQDEWPKRYNLVKLEGGRPQQKELKRWDGAALGGDEVAVPLDPATTRAFEDRPVIQLRFKLVELIEDIHGKNLGTPQETRGLLHTGEDLVAELHKISLKK